MRRRVFAILESAKAGDVQSRWFDIVMVSLIVLNVTAAILESVDLVGNAFGRAFFWFELVSVAVFSVEYLARVWSAVEHEHGRYAQPILGRLRFMLHPLTLIDLLAILPFYLSMLVTLDLRFLRVFRILRVFKLTRYSPAIEMLGRVVHNERQALGASATIMLVLLLFSSSMLYVVERDAQPVAFADIPTAMWWGIATLTTVGYGDVAPITPLGKLLGGMVTVLGMVMYALPTGILATGFAQEIKQRGFLVTWNLVARVDFFSKLNAEQIARIAGHLQSRVVEPDETIIRKGDIGDCMFFIVSGECRVELVPEPVYLTAGNFFGEIALVAHTERTATIRAATRGQLLVMSKKALDRLRRDIPELDENIKRVARDRLAELDVEEPSSSAFDIDAVSDD